MENSHILALFLLPVIFLAGCTSQPTTESSKTSQQTLITSDVSNMLPARAEIPTEFTTEDIKDITNETNKNPLISGLDTVLWLQTYKIEGSYGTLSVEYFVYKFSSSENANKYYDMSINDIIKYGGYTEIDLSREGCFGYKKDFGFEAKIGEGICIDRNVVFIVDFTSSNSFTNPDGFIKDGINLLDKKLSTSSTAIRQESPIQLTGEIVKTCTPKWTCSEWSECNQGVQTRACNDSNNCNINTGKPIEYQKCVPKCIENWSCTNWSECSDTGIQTRKCTDSNLCGTTITKLSESQSCVPITKVWSVVTSFSGSAEKVTDTFHIFGKKWRYTWNCIDATEIAGFPISPGSGRISIFVYPDGETASYVSTVLFAKCTDSPDTTNVQVGSGYYYFNVRVANVKSWSISVEDYK